MAKKPIKKKVEEAKAPPPSKEEYTITSGKQNKWKVTWGSRVKVGEKIHATSK